MRIRRFFKYTAVASLLLITVVMAWAITVSERPGGIAFPYWYGLSAGAKSSYYLAHPTLSANDTAAGLAATQTLTNKTLTSPTITGPTLTGTETHGGLMDINGGYALPVLAKTSNYTIAAADNATIFSNAGAAAAVTFVVPEASTILGRPFKFINVAAQTIFIDVDDADIIMQLTNTAGDKIASDATAGSSIILWAITSTSIGTLGSPYGTWADGN